MPKHRKVLKRANRAERDYSTLKRHAILADILEGKTLREAATAHEVSISYISKLKRSSEMAKFKALIVPDIEDPLYWQKVDFKEVFKWRLPFPFSDDPYCSKVMGLIDKNPMCLLIVPRGGGKSLLGGAYAALKHIMTSLIDAKVFYVSRSLPQAKRHVAEIKEYLVSGYSDFITDNKPASDALIDVLNPGGARIRVIPLGILDSIRGLHVRGKVPIENSEKKGCDLMVIDDALKSGELYASANSVDGRKVASAINRVIIPSWKDGCKVVCLATVISKHDFTLSKDFQDRFHVFKMGALIKQPPKSKGKFRSFWPQKFPLEWLEKQRRTMGYSAFSAEFLNTPRSELGAYLPQSKMRFLKSFEKMEGWEYIVSCDPGKHMHYAGVSILANKGSVWRLIEHKFLDDYDYVEQVELLNQLEADLKPLYTIIDNTNKVFDGFLEQGMLPQSTEMVHYSSNWRRRVAANLRRLIETGNIAFIEDDRVKDDLLCVSGDLKASEWRSDGSKLHHGEVFWCVAQACDYEAAGPVSQLVSLEEA